jgi:hypothetical protein
VEAVALTSLETDAAVEAGSVAALFGPLSVRVAERLSLIAIHEHATHAAELAVRTLVTQPHLSRTAVAAIERLILADAPDPAVVARILRGISVGDASPDLIPAIIQLLAKEASSGVVDAAKTALVSFAKREPQLREVVLEVLAQAFRAKSAGPEAANLVWQALWEVAEGRSSELVDPAEPAARVQATISSETVVI